MPEIDFLTAWAQFAVRGQEEVFNTVDQIEDKIKDVQDVEVSLSIEVDGSLTTISDEIDRMRDEFREITAESSLAGEAIDDFASTSSSLRGFNGVLSTVRNGARDAGGAISRFALQSIANLRTMTGSFAGLRLSATTAFGAVRAGAIGAATTIRGVLAALGPVGIAFQLFGSVANFVSDGLENATEKSADLERTQSLFSDSLSNFAGEVIGSFGPAIVTIRERASDAVDQLTAGFVAARDFATGLFESVPALNSFASAMSSTTTPFAQLNENLTRFFGGAEGAAEAWSGANLRVVQTNEEVIRLEREAVEAAREREEIAAQELSVRESLIKFRDEQLKAAGDENAIIGDTASKLEQLRNAVDENGIKLISEEDYQRLLQINNESLLEPLIREAEQLEQKLSTPIERLEEDFARAKLLFDEELISQETLDRQQALLDAARDKARGTATSALDAFTAEAERIDSALSDPLEKFEANITNLTEFFQADGVGLEKFVGSVQEEIQKLTEADEQRAADNANASAQNNAFLLGSVAEFNSRQDDQISRNLAAQQLTEARNMRETLTKILQGILQEREIDVNVDFEALLETNQ